MQPSEQLQSKKSARLLFVVLALALLIIVVGAIGLLDHKQADTSLKNQALSDKYNTAEAVQNPNQKFTLVYNSKAHQLTSGPAAIKLTEGDVVDIHMLATDEEYHPELAGYNVSTEAGNDENSAGDLRFAAYKTGTFKISDLGGDSGTYAAGQHVIATVEVTKK